MSGKSNDTLRETGRAAHGTRSLSARSFMLIVLMLILIGISNLAFGFYLFSTFITVDYKIDAWELSKTTAYLKPFMDVDPTLEKIANRYTEVKKEGLEKNSKEYLARFSDLMDEDYDSLRDVLTEVQKNNDASSLFVALIDKETNEIIYLIDSDRSELFCPPGTTEALAEGELDAYENGSSPSNVERLLGQKEDIPAYIGDAEQYGYLCTAGVRIEDIAGYETFIFSDYDMSEISSAGWVFVRQFLIGLLVVSLIVAFIIMRLTKKQIVQPIKRLADAAEKYADDRESGTESNNFRKIDISTGNEIEDLANAMAEMEEDVMVFEQNLARAAAEKERMNTELSVASSIQVGMLPRTFPPFPDRKEFDLYASMETAKEVGGDFYDFFFLDDGRLALVMADVSGKGIPASLFMMASKVLIMNTAKKGGLTPAQTLEWVNESICRNNVAEMFVTLWLGFLDIRTGRLTAANAGHEYPAIRRKGGEFELLKDKHGLVLGGFEDMKYTDYDVQLEPGDKLFLYTDGVTEATSADTELFGTDRMLASLNRDAAGEAGDAELPERVLEKVSEGVSEFVGEAPRFDDITMMCIRYNGCEEAPAELMQNTERKRGTLKELEITALIENLPDVIGFIEKGLQEVDCPPKAHMQIEMAVEEIFVNIASYAYAPDEGPATLRMEVDDDPLIVTVTFIDHGKPYDPLAKADPDVHLSAEDRQIGGLGIFMVKESMDEVIYEYKDGHNILKLKKDIEK